jgi:hypothetical protein
MNTLYTTTTAYHERESKRAFKLVTDNNFDFSQIDMIPFKYTQITQPTFLQRP